MHLLLLIAVFGALAAPAGAKTLKVVDTDGYGPIVVDGRGLTLYLFTKDDGRSRCYGRCARAWPPLFVKRRPRAGAGAKAGLIGTTKRRNGRLQATYAGRPLYFYVDEDDPGEIFCHDVFEYGGTWLLQQPNGEPVP